MAHYLAEFEFRFNLRRDISGEMFDRLIMAYQANINLLNVMNFNLLEISNGELFNNL